MALKMAFTLLYSLVLLGFHVTNTGASDDCDKTFTVSGGQISSHNFPSYPSAENTVCRYKIRAPPGNRIQFDFLPHSQITENYGCYYGSLRVFEGENPDLVLDAPSTQFCNSRSTFHKVYLSKGNSLILIHANKYGYNGFRFKLQYRFISGYNMVYSNTEGLMYSPNFMNKLLSRTKTYIYRIEANSGMRIYLSFSYINFHDDVNCSKTSLSIYEGTNTNGMPAEKRCGRNSTDFLSASNILTVQYKTNANTSSLPADHGFIAYYSSGIQGCKKFYSSSSGNVISPLYPGYYPNNAFCTYNITVEKEKTIYIDFRPVDLTSGDHLQVFERDTATGRLILRSTFSYETGYHSMSNSLLIVFKSNSMGTSDGFSWKYRATKGYSITLTSPGSYITSPLYPFNYPNNIIYSYTFKYSPSRSYYPAIYFHDIDMEESESCEGDSLSIYDGKNASAVLLDRLCGNKGSRRYMTSGDTLYVQFKANSKSSRRGFRAQFNIEHVYCNRDFSYSGSFYSPNYPDRYPHKVFCQNSITNPYGNRILLKIQHFDLESSKNCKSDSLKIYEKSISNETLVSTRCGNDTTHYVSKSNRIFLLLTSDSTNSRSGYNIQFKGCGGYYSIYNRQFTVESPMYPESYPTDSKCRYQFYGRFQDYGMRLEFSKFQLEDSQGCQNDNLTIYEGGMTSSNIKDIKCGNVTGDYFFQSQNLILLFRSNSHINGKGFRINVDTCSKLFTNETGTVTSPGFPSPVPTSVFCTYAIRLQMGAKVQLTFQNFSLINYPSSEYLKLYDGRDSSSRLVTTMTGSNHQNFLSSGNEMFIEFKSHWSRYDSKWYGFKLKYFDNQGYCSKHKPCKNNATCTNLSGDYRCDCPVNYKGKNCSEKITPCKSNPCLNEGVCSNIYSDEAPKFRCTCLDEYVGEICEHFVDPCLKYIAEDKWQRSIRSTFDPISMSPLCDMSLSTNWYRFTSKAGGLIPSSCPPLNSCGTSNSIWANGTLPLVARKPKTLTACLRNNGSCCSESWPIRVSKCATNGTDYFVYKLPPPPRCPMSYCAGSEIPCPNGLSSLTGYTPCNVKVPKFTSGPILSVSQEYGHVVFICKYELDAFNDAMNIEVIWYQGNSAKEIHKEMIQWWRRQATLQNKKNSKPLFQLGTTIYCKVRGWYGKFQGIASRYFESNHFFAGILVTPLIKYHKITEGGEPLKVNLTSTVPIVCPGNDECTVQAQLVHDTTEILLTACSVTFKGAVSSQSIEIHAKRDFIDDGNKVVTIKIAVVEGSNALDWQNHEEIKDLQVEVIDIGTAKCSSNGDPRLYTFDNRYYGHFQPGDHVFVKSLKRKFEVHVRTWQCGSVTCNCGIAAREGDDVILLDMCWDGIPRIRFASKRVPAEGTVVKRDPTGKSFVIKFPSGAFVRIDNFRWFGGGFANFAVQIPSDDFASTRGLCGTFDYNYHNEMLSNDGKYYDHLHYYGYTAPLGFSESWKMPFRKSLFYHRGQKSDCQKTKQETYCDCKGDPSKKDEVRCEVHKTLSQAPEFKQYGWKDIRYGGSNCKKRTRRSLEDVVILPDDDDAVDYVYDPKPLPNVTITWPTKTGKTEREVTNYCNKTMMESAPGKICTKISDFNLTSYLLQCIDDIKITDNYDFSSAAVRAMQEACEEIFLKNTSYWEKDPANNGSFVPPKEMADTLCPGLCSGHGTCEKGKCICDANYTSADCSIDKTKGPTIVSIPGKGICDVRNRSDCHLTRITGYDFIDSETLSCRADKVIENDGKQSKSSNTYRSFLLSFLEVLCDLEQHPVVTSGDPYHIRGISYVIYELQISNDRKAFSTKKLPYIIYDSKCMECNITSLSCTQKQSTCNINGYCFESGEKHISDPCFTCQPSLSKTDFTSSCKSPNNEEASGGIIMIVSVTVGAVVLIAVIFIVMYILKKKKQNRVKHMDVSPMPVATFNNQAYADNRK